MAPRRRHISNFGLGWKWYHFSLLSRSGARHFACRWQQFWVLFDIHVEFMNQMRSNEHAYKYQHHLRTSSNREPNEMIRGQFSRGSWWRNGFWKTKFIFDPGAFQRHLSRKSVNSAIQDVGSMLMFRRGRVKHMSNFSDADYEAAVTEDLTSNIFCLAVQEIL